MNCNEAQELLEAYALGALDPIELRRVAAHISECSDCARIARAYQEAIDHLALDVPLYKASPRLKDRVLGGIGVYRPRSFAGRLVANRIFAAAAAFVDVRPEPAGTVVRRRALLRGFVLGLMAL